MLKIRITYADKEEVEKALAVLYEHSKVLNISKAYPGRGKSEYSSIYIDVEIKRGEGNVRD